MDAEYGNERIWSLGIVSMASCCAVESFNHICGSLSAWHCRTKSMLTQYGICAIPAYYQRVDLLTKSYQGVDAGHKVATLDRRLVAISQAHKLAGHPSPTSDERVQSVLKGIKRTKGTAQTQKAPIVTEILREMLAVLPDTITGIRDRAILLIGFAGAFRGSELVSLDCNDVVFTSAGVVLTLKRSKTDQEGQGIKKAIPYGKTDTCPVRALKVWIETAALTSGPMFRPIDRHGNINGGRLTGEGVRLIVKRTASAAGLPEDLYAGHSLRAGLATSAAMAGVSERVIMQQTGHRSERMVRRYIREGELFKENAAGQVGL